MTNTYKAVLKSSLVMLVLFAVAGSSVAQAQQCIARVSEGTMARAEGITEVIGGVELRCRGGETGAFGFDPPAEIELTIELNTYVTNGFAAMMKDERILAGLEYGGTDSDTPSLGGDANYAGENREVLSADGTTISWTLSTDDLNIDAIGDTGGTVIISGILANASMVGDGEDVTAVVRVNGEAAHDGSLKLADVTTGLDITVSAVSGLQCESGEAMATVKFVEGFTSAIAATTIQDTEDAPQELVLNFRHIPEGVTVTPSMMGTGTALEADGSDLAPLTLQTSGEMSGVDEDGNVELSAAGAGQVVYMFDEEDTTTDDVDGGPFEGTSDAKAMEWNELTVTFTWSSGDDAPLLGSGYVTASYHPVTDEDDEIPRYVAGPTNMVVTIDDCTTTLLFPFVTNLANFDTGLVISNTSSESGSCTIEYSGSNAPDDMTTQPVAGGAQWIALASAIADGFQGYLTATCSFRYAYGFAFLSNNYGIGEPSAAQSYLAVVLD